MEKVTLTDKSPMLRVRFQTKGKGYLYVGKKSPSYAFWDGCDQKRGGGEPDGEAYWWVPENRAHIWTDITSMRRLASYARRDPSNTFSCLEVVDQFGNVVPLDDVCPPKK